ncbi:LOW QUALITY PROTEIN: uncharacterized protein LOC128255572 [Drosophila gunungcola]|uniref:LOW QUALITY PROTEIN: uncharacterized protein LOC128255572 n=1 Tax=Drosophila gunungcola TaxID=103775 RepID=UPI0022E6BA32|nr:LOW QUALITY PROTEIN: uncharacterized protein LOC128255572 [Drosophila gunungcola]
MQVPLLHRSNQMALLKKQIRRKARELRQRKRRARRRLEVMCRIRDQLLQRMRESIGLRQRDAELERRERARRAVGGMLAMYKHWLGNWSRALRLQNRLIRQQEQLKKRLHRRLHHLRKRLKKRRNPQRLVDKCFSRLAKAIRKWQNSPQYHQFIEGQDQIWEAEAQEVRKYLSDIRGKRRRKHRRTRASQDNDIEDFATFWNNEVLRKNTKAKERTKPESPEFKEELKHTPYKIPKAIRFKKKPKPKTMYISLDELLIQKELKRKMKKIRRQRKPDPTKPSFDELKLLVKELIEFHSPKKEKRASGKSNTSQKAPKKKHRNIKRSSFMSDISIFPESPVPQPQFQRKAKKADPLNLKKVLRMDDAPQPKVLKTKLLSAKKSRNYKLWKRKNKYVDLVIRDELRALFDQNKHVKHRKRTHSHHGKIVAVATGSEQFKKRSSWKGRGKKRGAEPKKKSSYGKQRTLVHRLLSDLSTIIKHRRHRKKHAHSMRGFSSSSSGSIISKEVLIDKTSRHSDAATDVMVRRLKKRPRPEAENSVTQIAEARDSVTSLSESLNKIIMANRPRKSMRKSFRGPLIMPKKIVIAPSKGQNESHYQSLKRNMMYIPTSVSQPVRPRKWKSFSSRKSISVPLLTIQRESKPFRQKERFRYHPVQDEDSERPNNWGKYSNLGRTIDNSVPQTSIQIDENRNRSVTLVPADSAGYSSPSSVSKTRLQQLREFHYEALPEELDKMDPTQLREYYDRIVRASEEVHSAEATERRGHSEARSTGPGRFLIRDLESDAKHKPLQMFLRDVIEKNNFIDYVADVKGFMLMVGRHPMWDSLQLLHDELKRTGFSKDEVKQMLSARYLEYLNGVATEMHFAKIEPPRDFFHNLVDTEPVQPPARMWSQADRPMAKSFRDSQRHSTRLSTRLIPFGKRGTRSATPYSHRSSQEARLDGTLYKKLIEQELKAAALEREDRKRRLFPTFSRIFGTYGSSVSLVPSLDMAPSEEQDLRDSEMRYSLQNLRSVLNEHKKMFKAFNRRRFTEEIVQKELEGMREEMLSTTQFRRPKEKPTTFTLKKRKRKLRPIEDLYYAPRKTCRMQKFTEGSECSDCECNEEQSGNSMVLEKCPRCGVKVPVPAATPSFHYISPTSSSEVLSSGSIEACAKNELLAGTLADICTRCGYIHDKGDPCSQLPQNTRNSKLLKRIKDSLRTAPECPAFCSPRGILKKPRNFDP